MDKKQLKVGDKVKYKILKPDEEDYIYTIHEINKDRCYMRCQIPNWTFQPMFIAKLDDIEVVFNDKGR